MTTYDLRGHSRGATGAIAFECGATPDRLVDFQCDTPAGFYGHFYEQGVSAGLAALRRFQMEAICALAGLPGATNRVRAWLDVGAGTGIAIDYLNETYGGRTGFEAFGLEPATPRSIGHLYRGDLDAVGHLPGLPASFDVISFLDVLEHFSDPASALQRASALLNPSGHLIIKVPNRAAAIYQAAKALRFVAPPIARRVLRRLYQIDYPPPHYYYFDRESLTALLERSGFQVERVDYIAETPLRFIWTRLWGFALPKRVAAFAVLVAFKAFCLGPRQECLVVAARKRVQE